MDFVFGTNRDVQVLEQAAEMARKALSLDEASFLAHALLADVYRTKGQYGQAVSQAERALALNPNDPTAYRGLGNALNSLGRSGEAVEVLQTAMRLDPHYAVYYSTDLAAAFRHLGKYEKAISVLKDALSRNPDWAHVYFELAMNCLMAWSVAQNRDATLLDQAMEMTERLLAIDAYSLYAHFALPLVDLYQKQPEKALADADKLMALAPDSADSHALKAAVLIAVGRGEDAVEMMTRAMQLNPDAPAWYLNTLATAYVLTGREDEAVSTHKKVLESNPSHADAYNARLELTLLYAGS
jgi:tetratricopeptide (TPR) repeat protein